MCEMIKGALPSFLSRSSSTRSQVADTALHLNRLFLMLSPDGPEEAVCHVLRGPKFRGQVTARSS
jgi:hypothetical protein